jgi:hypothetical protein
MRNVDRSTTVNGRPAFWLAFVALLLLASGVARLFVVCSGPHADRSVELAHASGHCLCSHGPSDGARDPYASHPSDASHDACDPADCKDVPLRIEPSRAPDAGTHASAPVWNALAALPVDIVVLAPPAPRRIAGAAAAVPRPRPSTELRRTVVLNL